MLDEKGKIIATCERERLEKTAYITVKENGEISVCSEKIDCEDISGTKLAVATITRLIRQKENTLYLYIHSVSCSLYLYINSVSYSLYLYIHSVSYSFISTFTQ